MHAKIWHGLLASDWCTFSKTELFTTTTHGHADAMPHAVDEDDELLSVLLLTCLKINEEWKAAKEAFMRQQKRPSRCRPGKKCRPTWNFFSG